MMLQLNAKYLNPCNFGLLRQLFSWNFSQNHPWSLHFIIINNSNVRSERLHLSGLNVFPAVLNKCSTGEEVYTHGH